MLLCPPGSVGPKYTPYLKSAHIRLLFCYYTCSFLPLHQKCQLLKQALTSYSTAHQLSKIPHRNRFSMLYPASSQSSLSSCCKFIGPCRRQVPLGSQLWNFAHCCYISYQYVCSKQSQQYIVCSSTVHCLQLETLVLYDSPFASRRPSRDFRHCDPNYVRGQSLCLFFFESKKEKILSPKPTRQQVSTVFFQKFGGCRGCQFQEYKIYKSVQKIYQKIYS